MERTSEHQQSDFHYPRRLAAPLESFVGTHRRLDLEQETVSHDQGLDSPTSYDSHEHGDYFDMECGDVAFGD